MEASPKKGKRRASNDEQGGENGVERRTPAHQERSFDVRILSQEPGLRLMEINNFVNRAEARKLIEVGGMYGLERSKIIGSSEDSENDENVVSNGSLARLSTPARTSQTSWFNTKPQQKHWVVEDFEDRIDSLLRSPIVADFHSPPSNPRPPLTRRRRDRENLQLIHYDPGQVYHLHYDKVDDHDKNGDADRDGQRKARTRAATLLTYLNSPTRGGETFFPHACGNKGIAVNPEMGKAILFWNQKSDGSLDKNSRHQAKAVVRTGQVDEKFAVTAWIQEARSAVSSRGSTSRTQTDELVQQREKSSSGNIITYFNRLCVRPATLLSKAIFDKI